MREIHFIHALFIRDFISGYRQSQFPRPGVRLHQQHSEMWRHIHRSLRPDTQLSSNKVREFLLHLFSFVSSFIAFIYMYLELTGYMWDWKKQSERHWLYQLWYVHSVMSVFISFFSFSEVEIFLFKWFLQEFCSKHLDLYCTAAATLWLTKSAIGEVLHSLVLHLLEMNAKVYTNFVH